MKNRIFIIISIILSACFSPFESHAGYPIVNNFPRKVYDAGSQFWDIKQDEAGRMYFGNQYGLLIFDGCRWELSTLPNSSTVRSLLFDTHHSGRLYGGGSEEFGYWDLSDSDEGFRYKSVSDLLPKGSKSFNEVWDIMESDSTIWFRADRDIFRYSGKELKRISLPDKVSASCIIGGKLFLALETGEIFELKGDIPQRLSVSDVMSGKKTIALLPYHSGVMAVTDFDGLWSINGNECTPIETPIDSFLRENHIFSAATDKGKYAFGTVHQGVVVIDFIKGNISYANRSTGMQNNTVLTTFFDAAGNLWSGLDDGIDYVIINSPITNLFGSTKTIGAGYASCLHRNLLYLGTNQGLYVSPYPIADSPLPQELPLLIRGQVWGIDLIGDDVFVSSDAGLYYSRGGTFQKINGISGAWKAAGLKNYPGYALVSGYNSFYILHNVGGTWINQGEVRGYNDIGGQFIEDNNGEIWLPNWLKGIYRLTIDPVENKVVHTKFFNKQSGLPGNQNVGVALCGDRPVITGEMGYYRIASDGNTIFKDEELSTLFSHGLPSRLHQSPNEDIWCVTRDNIMVASRDATGKYVVDSVSYAGIASNIIAGFDNFNFLSDNRLIISGRDGFYDIITDNQVMDTVPSSHLFLTRLISTGDSIVGIADIKGKMASKNLDYDHNSLKFEFVWPEYRSENTIIYSCKLENYDSEWSNWSTTPTKEYTQLHEGEYKMRIKALNKITMTQEELEYEFKILPPWYRSVWAKIIYLILFLAAAWGAYKLISRQSRLAAMRQARNKERELEVMRRQAREEALQKDYEIAELKGRQLEQTVKHKSEELSNITMNVVRKNEILMEISEKLANVGKDGNHTDTAKRIERIQAQIRENISHDEDWKSFVHNFDSAYDDFTKRLIAKHPSLTTNDLRICCYIRMGLSSKDIAPLFNITYRSVEMTRYRLRKKLGLERDTNLTDYLMRI